MYNVYFEASDKKEYLIGSEIDKEECYKIITKYLEDRNYKSPYWRKNMIGNDEWIDVGSYTQFFWIREKLNNE